MADYRSAIKKVLKHEGGYVHDPNDAGGETYKGISRKNFSDWAGWKMIDLRKQETGFPDNLKNTPALDEQVIRFYEISFWDKIDGDKLVNQEIADMLVDIAVNQGNVPAIKRAQMILGLEQTGKINEGLVDSLNTLA